MNSTGKFLVSAFIIHAANLKKIGDTQTAVPVAHPSVPVNANTAPPLVSSK